MVAQTAPATPATPARSGIPAPRASTATAATPTPSPATRAAAARPRIPLRSTARAGPTSGGAAAPTTPAAVSKMKSSSSMPRIPSASRLAQPASPLSREVPAVPTPSRGGVKGRAVSDSTTKEVNEAAPARRHARSPPLPPTDVPQAAVKSTSEASRSEAPTVDPSAETEELRERLRRLDIQYRVLQAEHGRCQLRTERTSRSAGADDKLLDLLTDREALSSIVRNMPKGQRTGLLSVIAEACRPSDIQAQIELLELYKESRTGVLGRLDDDLCERVVEFLDRKEILSIRLVAKRFNSIATRPRVWKAMCHELEATWDGMIDLSNYRLGDDGDWLGLYKRLWQREKQWTNGQVQSLVVLPGHTNYVTSLKLVGETLISGSYDDTIRIWNLPYAVASAKAVPPPQVITAKSISSIDYYAPEGVLVTGSHDVGRASVWRQVDGEWKVERILSGHLHGTRAVAINAQWLVSVGSDKAIVVWDWRTGNKVVRFGQQTNVCVGMRLLDNFIISATVDGVIRSFSIAKREMLGQFKLSDLAAKQPQFAAQLKDVGVGALGMLTWFEAEGRFMACATKDIVIRLAWDWADAEEQADLSEGIIELQGLQGAAAASTPVRPRKSGNGVSPATRAESPRNSPLHPRATASPAHRMTPTAGSKLAQAATNTSDDDMDMPTTTGTTSRFALHRRPRIVEILDITGTERGAFEAGRVRIVTSRRLSAKSGAERRVIVGTERASLNGGPPTMQLVPLGGKWDSAGLKGASKNPMSLALDHDKLVYGCSDGSIVVAGFVGLGAAS